MNQGKWLWVAAAALVVSACGGGGDDDPQMGKVSLAVTDAPVDDADAVVVSFTGVELLDADGNVRNTFELDPEVQLDLLTLQGTNSAFLIQDERIEPGEYQEVRLLVDTPNASCNGLAPPYASYITVDGMDYPLIVPSGGSSGLKVKGPITVAAGGTASYTIDFDLRQSIAERGATSCYNLKPVLRVVDNAEIGSLEGTVDATLLSDTSCSADPLTGEGAAVYVYADAGVVPDDVDGTDPEPLTSAFLTSDGAGGFTYEVGFLLAGDYTVALSCQAGEDDPETDDDIGFLQSADVEIQAGMVSAQNFELVIVN